MHRSTTQAPRRPRCERASWWLAHGIVLVPLEAKHPGQGRESLEYPGAGYSTSVQGLARMDGALASASPVQMEVYR